MIELTEEMEVALLQLAHRKCPSSEGWILIEKEHFHCLICDKLYDYSSKTLCDITNHGISHLKEYNLLAFI